MTTVLLALLLAGPLETWREEIEKAGRLAVYLLRTEPGAKLPEGTPYKAIVEQFTENPNFQQQFAGAQALSITYQEAGQRMSFVLLNRRQTPEADEGYVIAHEYGHLWLKAQRYPAPAYMGGPSSCLSILAGDAVQHVLIREEMDRRGIDWRPAWKKTLEAALGALEARENPSTPERCQALAQAVLWIDVALGMPAAEWPGRERFLDLLGRRFPVIQPVARELAAELAKGGLAEKAAHQRALEMTFGRLKAMALTLPK